MLAGRRHADKHDLHLTPEQVCYCWCGAAIRHMRHFYSGHHLEQLAGKMQRASVTGRPKGQPARICFRVSYELGNRLDRNRWVNGNDERTGGHADQSNVGTKLKLRLS